MPLIKSTKKEAFKKNIATEVKAGKPIKQAVAIAYSEKREAEKAKKKKMKANLAVHLLIALGFDEHLFMKWQAGKNPSYTKKGTGRKHKEGKK